jgi:hypothetical protein
VESRQGEGRRELGVARAREARAVTDAWAGKRQPSSHERTWCGRSLWWRGAWKLIWRPGSVWAGRNEAGSEEAWWGSLLWSVIRGEGFSASVWEELGDVKGRGCFLG